MAKQSAIRAAAPQAPAVHTERRSRPTVTVMCKVPNGIVLRGFSPQKEYEPVMGGGAREVTVFKPTGQEFSVRGPASPNGTLPKGFKRPFIAGGYAMTPGVPADLWDLWLEQNRNSPIVTNKLVFAVEHRDEAVAEAKDNRAVMSGLEPIVPDKDPRIPRSSNPNVSVVATAEEAEDRSAQPRDVAWEDTE